MRRTDGHRMNKCAVWFILWLQNMGFQPKSGHSMNSSLYLAILWPIYKINLNARPKG